MTARARRRRRDDTPELRPKLARQTNQRSNELPRDQLARKKTPRSNRTNPTHNRVSAATSHWRQAAIRATEALTRPERRAATIQLRCCAKAFLNASDIWQMAPELRHTNTRKNIRGIQRNFVGYQSGVRSGNTQEANVVAEQRSDSTHRTSKRSLVTLLRPLAAVGALPAIRTRAGPPTVCPKQRRQQCPGEVAGGCGEG